MGQELQKIDYEPDTEFGMLNLAEFLHRFPYWGDPNYVTVFIYLLFASKNIDSGGFLKNSCKNHLSTTVAKISANTGVAAKKVWPILQNLEADEEIEILSRAMPLQLKVLAQSFYTEINETNQLLEWYAPQ